MTGSPVPSWDAPETSNSRRCGPSTTRTSEDIRTTCTSPTGVPLVPDTVTVVAVSRQANASSMTNRLISGPAPDVVVSRHERGGG
ncbi:hypothetical protein [Pseudonocardia humida]|uniref:Uncharacterized protein n=1 Tax=Pseudonocardia humida TaxID=2800819 RepID=A0ABT1A335_9PSEU|nr:hypothetical protein [Pseudonocardia humida]MCO1657407.1 hypothetical protein [Pseudonocardia humida]